MNTKDRHIETRLIHAGEPRPLIGGAVSMPIFQSSTYAYAGQESYDDLRYIRMNNTPNHAALHGKLAAVENAEAALVAASGMGAISSTLLTFLAPGDRLLAQSGLYGGTHEFILKDLAALNIAVDFLPDDPNTWPTMVRPETRLVYCESITNPLMRVADLPALAAFARQHDLLSVIDNTFTTPINFRPAEAGFDLILHSGTKYLNGHSDIVAWAVVGRAEPVARINHKLVHLGATLDPHACFLLHRGLKTLAVRMRQHNASALAIAGFLQSHPAVETVHYPGLESCPDHARARELFFGFGGMIGFELTGGVAEAERFIGKLQIPILAPSLGGVETLITRPATTSHAGMDPDQRRAMGISDRLIRLSVGIEATEDLMADLEQALDMLAGP